MSREVVPYFSDLERLGLPADVLWAKYAAAAPDEEPAGRDGFLAWLRDRGEITGHQLVELHRSKDTVVLHETDLPTPTLVPNETACLEDRYQMLGAVGTGGMGEVFVARDRELRRKVAVKKLREEALKKPVLVSRFLAEAAVTAQLDHPNILPVYGIEYTRAGVPAYAMKLVRGQSLSKLLSDARAQGTEGEEDALHDLTRRLEIFLRICDAMSYAHEKGVLHRDLKPDNIMVGRHGETYVLDWGLARYEGCKDETLGDEESTRVELGPVSSLTRAGATLGTPPYMSPEQAMGRDLTPASDQFSLGLLLFEIVALKRALEGADVREVMLNAAHARLVPLEHVNKVKIDRDLVAIIQKACSRRPGERYANVDALAADVRRYLRHAPVRANPDSSWRASLRWVNAHPTAVVSFVAGCMGLVLVAGAAGIVQSQVLRREAAQAQERSAEALAIVGRQRTALDQVLGRHKGVLHAMSQSVVQQWEHGRPADLTEHPPYFRNDVLSGRLPSDWAVSGRYGFDVSYSDWVVFTAPGVAREAVSADLARLAPAMKQLGIAYREAIEPGAGTWSPVALRAAVEGGAKGAAWSYVGLESGVLLNFPGLTKLGPEYDPRLRPWYQVTLRSREPLWGEPYMDASGYSMLIPCNDALVLQDGTVLGVAGLDITLDRLAQLMSPADLRGPHQAWLVDEDGTVLLSTLGAPVGVAGENAPAVRQLLLLARVVDAVHAGRSYGLEVEEDGSIIGYTRLGEAPWTYVLRMGEPLAQ